MSSDLVSKRLGKYEIHAGIGKGGMGTVYRGYDPLLDRRVAIKVLAPHLVWEPGFIERFLREARAAARLKHINIVTIYDVGQEDNWHYIVMEYLEGQTLSRIIRQQGALPAQQALAILRQLAQALDYAHQQGLIHRDIKPANIMVNSAGDVSLTDFGVARAAQETGLTMTGAVVGTPQYMSPEQAQGEGVDHRTDIYSLGVVAFEMLAGQAPFAATTPHAVLHQLIYDPPPPLRSRRPDLPAEVDGVMSRALAKKPASRYETAQAFVQALSQALAGKKQQEAPRPRPAVVPEPQPRPVAKPRPRAAPATVRPRSGGWVLWLAWILTSAGGWAVGWLVADPVGQAVSWPIGEAVDFMLAEIAGGAVAWATLGLVLGIAQWLLLRRYIRNAGWWVLATVVGWAVVGELKWGQGSLMDTILFEAIGGLEEAGLADMVPAIVLGIGMLMEGLAGFVVGVAQWLVLQRQARRAGLWVLASALGWAASAGALGGIGWALGDPSEEMMRPLFSILGGILPGLFTATALVRMLPRNRKDLSAKR